MRQIRFCCLLFVGFHAASPAAEIDGIHFMIPGGAGSGWDATGRAAGMVLRNAALVDTASFENISGAGGGRAIGTLIETAERSRNTLMVNSTPIIVRSLTKIFPYSFRDLTPVARIIGDYQVLAARADSPLSDFNDVLERFRANPRSIKIAGGSVRGDLDHLVPALAFRAAGENPRRVTYVPYDGGDKALAGFLTGEGDLLSTGLSEALSYHRAGKLKIIAVTAPQRIAGLGELPTFREQGVDFEFVNWRGFFAAPGIGSEQADRYASVLQQMLATEEWEIQRSRNGWQNLYLPRPEFVKCLEEQELVIGYLMLEMGFIRESAP
jgi:putative tricarboxylic transport membrane protein